MKTFSLREVKLFTRCSCIMQVDTLSEKYEGVAIGRSSNVALGGYLDGMKLKKSIFANR